MVAGESGREFSYVRFHRRIPVIVEPKRIHFLDRLIGGPVLLRHAIGGHHHSGSVAPEITVNENFLLGVLLKKPQEFSDLCVGRRRPTTHRDIDKSHTEGFRLCTLARDRAAISAQVYNRGDAKLFQLYQALRRGLRAAQQCFTDFSGIRHAGYF